MVGWKNASATLAVTATLMVGLFILFPSTVQGAQVTNMTVGSISGAGGDFTVRVVVDIPEGEHIPLDAAAVYTVPSSTPHGGNVVGLGVPCTGATITAITTALPRVQADFTGYGYGPSSISTGGSGAAYGYGYAYGASDFDFDGGYGYGYGHSTSGGTATVTIRATGCVGVTFPTSIVQYDIQALVGSATQKLASLPVTATFVDPSDDGGDPQPVVDPSGITIAGGILDLSTGTLNVPVAAIPGIENARLRVTQPGVTIPPGTKIAVMMGDAGAATPDFAVLPETMTAQFGGRPVAFHFQANFEAPDGSKLDVDGAVELVITIEVPDSYFDSIPNANRRTFQVRAFDDDGALKANQPTVRLADGCSSGCDPWRFDVTIRHFSSFAGAGVSASGGGGGGGWSPVTPTPTVPPVTPPDVPVDPVDPVDPDPADPDPADPDPADPSPEPGTGGGPAPGTEPGPWSLIGKVAAIALVAIVAAVIFVAIRRRSD